MAEKPRVLLIDDSEATVEGLGSYLSPRFDVVTAFDGLSALNELGAKPFDLVIADLILPVVSGLRLISFLRQTSPQTPIIAMTGWGKYPSELATESKADVVLIKPFELEELDRSVSKLLPGKRSGKAT
jgi:DNA-binding response OmpR family regulator